MLRLTAISDGSVKQALRHALKDNRISDAEVIAIIRSTLDHDAITAAELRDLEYIRDHSVTISHKAKGLITQFVAFVKKLNTYFKKPAARKVKANDDLERQIFDFMEKRSGGAFIHINRLEIGLGLLCHLRDPGLIDQGGAPLCGPAAILYSIAVGSPHVYARFVMDLYEKGEAQLGKMKIKPWGDLLRYRPPRTGKHAIMALNWMIMASIRNSEAGFFDWLRDKNYNDIADKGATTINEMKDWLEEIGFEKTVVRRLDDNDLPGKLNAARQASRLQSQGNWVFLLLNSNMLKDPTTESKKCNHWVVLTSEIAGLHEGSLGVEFELFTWGRPKDKRRIPAGTGRLPMSQFLDHFYHFVAAKDGSDW